MKAAVIGSPVSHSLSPAIFEFISLDLGKAIEYRAIEVKPAHLSQFLAEHKAGQDFVGLNVTLPLKESMLEKVDSASPAAKAMGAVNVVHFEQGKIFGHNTDVIGIEKTLQGMNFAVASTECLLWGAGGSAKAVAFVLGKLKAKAVYVFNRGSRGEELAQQFSALYPKTVFKAINSLSEIGDKTISLMINTTPLGMAGQESGTHYFKQCEGLKFSQNALAFDLIYVPEQTDFLKQAAALGLKTVGGLGMLIDQALATWEIWIGPLDHSLQLHQKLKKMLKGMLTLRHDPAALYLTGFMGAGKTTVGRKLSEITRREFIDTDQVIESLAHLSIPEIFAQHGEGQFRKFESAALSQLAAKKNSIISLGGGSLKIAANAELVLSSGKLIYLEADPETLEKRMKDQNVVRPLLQNLSREDRLQKITTLLHERESSYAAAHFTVKTRGLNPTQVAFEIISKLGESN